MPETKSNNEKIPLWTYNEDGRFRPAEEVLADIDASMSRRAALAAERKRVFKRRVAGAAVATLALTHPVGQETVDVIADKAVETVKAAGDRLDTYFNGPETDPSKITINVEPNGENLNKPSATAPPAETE